MEWVESTCHTVRCLKKVTRVETAVPTMLLVKSDVNLVTETIVVATVAQVVAVVTVVDAAETVVAVVAIAVDAVVTEAAVVEIAVAAATIVAVIGVRGASAVTSMVTVDLVRIVQSVLAEMMKAVEIVAQGDPPVVMMVAADDRVRLANAKLSK